MKKLNFKDNLKEYLYDLDEFITIYDKNIHIFNYEKLLVLKKKEIKIEVNEKIIIIKGDNLLISKLTNKEILIEGIVNTLEFSYEK